MFHPVKKEPDDQKDALSKVPFNEMIERPRSIPNRNPIRQKPMEQVDE